MGALCTHEVEWKVEIALAEAKATFKTYQIDLQNKPEWYAPKVNPASKVVKHSIR